MEPQDKLQPYPAARFIKEIGRGKKGARSLSRDDARELYAAMLDGRVSDLELGALMLAMRIKGESVDEIAGFLDAAEDSFEKLAAPEGEFAPVVIPSYNGSRNMPNLAACAAARARGGAGAGARRDKRSRTCHHSGNPAGARLAWGAKPATGTSRLGTP